MPSNSVCASKSFVMSDTQRKDPKAEPTWRRMLMAMSTEFVGIHPRLHAYNALSRLLPAVGAGAERAALLRGMGFSVGSGTEIEGELRMTGPRHLPAQLRIGTGCYIGPECLFDLSERLTLGDNVTVEPGVMLLTVTHELDIAAHRAGPLVPNPVTIGNGVWLRARCIVLPGVKVGDGAVVEAGAVVNKDVAPNTRVGGIPAVPLETLKAEP